MDAVYDFPDLASPYGDASFSPPSFAVGAGVETVGDVEGVTTLSVDFTASRLTIVLNTTLTNPTWTGAAFNGPLFTLLSPGTLGITGATVDASTTLAGFDAGRVTFSDSQIGINWNGLSYLDGQQVVVDFTFVPEPSSVVTLGVGCALPLLAIRRRRRRLAA